MRRKALFITIILLLCCVSFSTAAYADQPSVWAIAEVNAAITLKIAPETLTENYTSPITRAEFCGLMVAMLTVKTGQDIGTILREKGLQARSNVFTDTDDRNVLAANALGIVNGMGNGIFAPEREITRQEAAVMLVRAAGLLGGPGLISRPVTFADQAQIAPWAKSGVAAATAGLFDLKNNLPLMAGTGNSMFSPLGSYTREQAIITAKRLFNAFPDLPAATNADTAANTFPFPYKFSANDLYGNTVNEASLGERELFFVHYWATWCPPCVNEMPELGEIAKKYGGRVGFIALLDDYSDSAGLAIKIAEAAGVSFIMVDANNKDLSALKRMLDSGYVPTTVLIGQDGKMIGAQLIGALGSRYGTAIEDALNR